MILGMSACCLRVRVWAGCPVATRHGRAAGAAALPRACARGCAAGSLDPRCTGASLVKLGHTADVPLRSALCALCSSVVFAWIPPLPWFIPIVPVNRQAALPPVAAAVR